MIVVGLSDGKSEISLKLYDVDFGFGEWRL